MQTTRAAGTRSVEKAPTGIHGLDEVLGGGVPRGRPTLVCGGPGSGKTTLALECIAHAAAEGEPGVILTFEETPEDLIADSLSFGLDLEGLIADNKIIIDHVELPHPRQGGAFDLEGLFIRIDHAIRKVGARRIAFDTMENLFSALPDKQTLRAEVHRLFRWLKDRDMTAIVTAEAGDTGLTRAGMEAYVSDCVILLEQNVVNEVSTRRLRIIKYRGSAHGTNEFPFIIDEEGISVVPITGANLRRRVSTKRISTGVPGLDGLLEGEGPYRGSIVLRDDLLRAWQRGASAVMAAANGGLPGHAWEVEWTFDGDDAQLILTQAG